VSALWAEKITHPPSRADKLGIRPGMTVLLAGASDATLRAEVERRGARVVSRAPDGGVDLLFFGVERAAMLNRLERLSLAITPDGALWVLRPKGPAGVSESAVREAGRRSRLVDVKVVSFSDTHTADKFVIPVARRHPPKTGRKSAGSEDAVQLGRHGTRRAKSGSV
jgi:hypothetical protein